MTSEQPERRKSNAKAKTVALVEQAYKAGFSEGSNERQKLVNTLRTTNQYLWKELCRLDETDPTEGIRISLVFAERLAAALQKRHSGYARDLRKQIRNSNRKLSKLLKILEHCKEFT